MRLPAPLVALAVALTAALGSSARPQDVDADLATGIRQVEEGDYAAATITLDRAARVLAGRKDRTHDLARAYLHLGVAYVGLGSETSAKARFRDALAHTRELRLDPSQFSPKVIELFERAREEDLRGAVAGPASAGSPAPPTGAGPTKKKSKAPLILIGVGGAAAAGVAVAAGGGAASPPSTTAASADTSDTINSSVSGTCGGGVASDTVSHRFVVSRSGTLEALLSWTTQGRVLSFEITTSNAGERLASSSPASNTSARLSMPVQNQEYWARVSQVGGGPCVSYTLTLTYPH